MVRWLLEDLPPHLRAQVGAAAKPAAPLKPRKYRNEPVVVDDIRFDSRLEADRYLQLRELWNLGGLRWFMRQVPFDCGGGVTYRADFVIVWPEGPFSRVTVEDCKGMLTQDCINKLKQVRARYGIVVELVEREGGRLVARPWRE